MPAGASARLGGASRPASKIVRVPADGGASCMCQVCRGAGGRSCGFVQWRRGCDHAAAAAAAASPPVLPCALQADADDCRGRGAGAAHRGPSAALAGRPATGERLGGEGALPSASQRSSFPYLSDVARVMPHAGRWALGSDRQGMVWAWNCAGPNNRVLPVVLLLRRHAHHLVHPGHHVRAAPLSSCMHVSAALRAPSARPSAHTGNALRAREAWVQAGC